MPGFKHLHAPPLCRVSCQPSTVATTRSMMHPHADGLGHNLIRVTQVALDHQKGGDLFGAVHPLVGMVHSWPVCGRMPWGGLGTLTREEGPQGGLPEAASTTAQRTRLIAPLVCLDQVRNFCFTFPLGQECHLWVYREPETLKPTKAPSLTTTAPSQLKARCLSRLLQLGPLIPLLLATPSSCFLFSIPELVLSIMEACTQEEAIAV